jgi:hypothetical protein
MTDKLKPSEQIAALERRLEKMVEHMLNVCPDLECLTCGALVCPHAESLHFHHDGCPACWAAEQEIENVQAT